MPHLIVQSMVECITWIYMYIFQVMSHPHMHTIWCTKHGLHVCCSIVTSIYSVHSLIQVGEHEVEVKLRWDLLQAGADPSHDMRRLSMMLTGSQLTEAAREDSNRNEELVYAYGEDEADNSDEQEEEEEPVTIAVTAENGDDQDGN